MTRDELKTARDFGRAFAKWCRDEQPDWFSAVSIYDMLESTSSISDGDCRAMEEASVLPDAREYWEGFNAVVAEAI